MANGRYQKHRPRRHNKRKVTLMLSLVLLMALAISGTVAFLVTESQSVTNSFVPGHVGCVVSKNFDGTYSVEPDDATNTKVYLRAEVVANYEKNGDIHWSKPELDVSGENWEKIGDFYYYQIAVEPTAAAKKAVSDLTITIAGTAPSGYKVQIQVLGEAIQASPDNVTWDNRGMN